MIQSLYAALKTFVEDSPVGAMVEGLFLNEAPQGAQHEYVTMRLIAGNASYSFTDVMDECVIQFSVWSGESSPAAALDIADWLALWLEDVPLDMPDGVVVRVMRLTTPLVLPDPDGVWQVTFDCSFWIQDREV